MEQERSGYIYSTSKEKRVSMDTVVEFLTSQKGKWKDFLMTLSLRQDHKKCIEGYNLPYKLPFNIKCKTQAFSRC